MLICRMYVIVSYQGYESSIFTLHVFFVFFLFLLTLQSSLVSNLNTMLISNQIRISRDPVLRSHCAFRLSEKPASDMDQDAVTGFNNHHVIRRHVKGTACQLADKFFQPSESVEFMSINGRHNLR